MENKKSYEGIEYSTETIHGLEVSFIEVKTRSMAAHMGWPIGKHATIHTGRLRDITDQNPAIECLAECLRRFLAPYLGKKLLIVGRGNASVPPGSLGSEVIRNIPAHALSQTDTPCVFETVSLLVPGTIDQTNISTETLISGTAQAIDAACVVQIGVGSATTFREIANAVGLSIGCLKLENKGETQNAETISLPFLTITVPLLLNITPAVIRMLRLDVDQEGISLMDVNMTTDIQAAVTVISHGILRTAYPEWSGPLTPDAAPG